MYWAQFMPALLLSLGLGVLLWGAIAVLYGSLYLSVALFLVATCCFPAEFFHVEAGGLTWTLDRLALLIIAFQFGLQWQRGQLRLFRIETTDIAAGLFMLWLIARAFTQPWGAVLPAQPPTMMHLVNGYLIPFFLYTVLRMAQLKPESLRSAFYVVVGLGVYLSLTALLEVAQAWSLVFPRFISDPALGIHFGRARGPMLQSVRLGMVLIACWLPLVIYTVWLHPRCRFRITLAAGYSLTVGAAIFATYTRSVWLGLGFAILSLVVLGLQRLPRRVAISGMLAAVSLIGILKGPDLVAFKREFSAAETRESTYMRAAFAYVSFEMFKDRPLAGYGFNQFQVYNRPYLADRSTNIRLESIRGYVHHNGFLSLLVDLGIVGVALYAFLALTAVVQCIVLWRAAGIPDWVRGLALITLSIGGVHIIQMAFHELSFSSIENTLLFASLALVVAAKDQFCFRPKNVFQKDPLRTCLEAEQNECSPKGQPPFETCSQPECERLPAPATLAD